MPKSSDVCGILLLFFPCSFTVLSLTSHALPAGAPGRCSRSPCCTKFAGHSGFCSGPRALNDAAGAARLRQEEPEETTDQLQRRPSGAPPHPTPLPPVPSTQTLHQYPHTTHTPHHPQLRACLDSHSCPSLGIHRSWCPLGYGASTAWVHAVVERLM